ncbi:hypothetical protein GCM10023213_19720 [Prosthecobacter algae]|uniref:Uncharacterized protein n=1 Tax=Prosthecobacter algae TaxID=1144682 RepID=A0ABP9P5D1_9BACT
MSAPTEIHDGLLTWADLEKRWQPPMESPALRRQWMRRMAQRWGLRPMSGTRGETARFRSADVMRAEARGSGNKQF